MVGGRATRWTLPAATALSLLGAAVGAGPAAAGGAPGPATGAARPQAAAAGTVHASNGATAALSALPARALLLYEQDSGTVVFAENGDTELPIASTTKMMTAYVTAEREPAGRTLVEQPYAAGEGESLAPVPAGARLSTADMLRAMLLPSGNNVAYSLAIDVAGTTSAFVSLMNATAARLRLGRTHYTTPIGLDTPAGNYSTADDLARLARVVLANRLLAKIVDEPSAQLADGVVVTNRNDLLEQYPWVVGVKTGNTAAAGECLVGAASLNGVHLISVVLGAPSEAARDSDTLALLRYGLSLYRSVRIAVRGQTYGRVPVEGRARPVSLIAERSSTLVVARDVRLHVSRDGVPDYLRGPLAARSVEGSIEVEENGRVVESVPLVTAAALPATLPIAARRAVAPAWYAAGGVGLAVALLGCSLLLMRTRATRSRSATGLRR